ncbi:unnamed protein product [Linum trigynum]|uniref:Coiled-coil domain-containing protein 94 n=1 Tax=Linum trigynum TaxID=586398 RepID=A0AAV2DRS5_9ROSI
MENPPRLARTIRAILPVSVRCDTCQGYMYKGSKFNIGKEEVAGEAYLGIPIWRLHFRCSHCLSAFTIKSDPKNSEFVAETGATRQRNLELEQLRAALDEVEVAALEG